MAGTVLFFTSPIGLGHASRDAAVGLHMDEPRFVTGGPAARMLSEYGFEVEDVYHPPPFDVRGGRLRRPAAWLARYYLYYRRCRGVAGKIIRRYGPDLVVADEDFAAVAEARDRNIPSVLITDILESRFASGVAGAVERRMNGAMRDLMDGCRAVILPECGRDGGNVHRVGPIVRETGRTRDELRAIHGMNRKTVLVTVGGTAAGSFLLEAMGPVASRMSDEVDTVTVPGPSLGGTLVRDLHEMIYAADAVVSLAGRSTMDEAAAYGTPGVFIPISGHFEQEDNARRAGCHPQDVDRLYEVIRTKLDSPRKPSDAGGARRAAEVIAAIRNNA